MLMTYYIIMEFFCFLAIAFLKITNSFPSYILHFFTILPSIITLIYLFLTKKFSKKFFSFPINSFFFTLGGDFFLIYSLKSLGIYLFLLLQINYYFYLTKTKNNKGLLLFLILNFICLLLYRDKFLFIEGALYAFFSLNNIIKSIYAFSQNKLPKLYLLAFLFLFICDFNLFFLTILKDLPITSVNFTSFFLTEWLSYILFQITLVYLLHANKPSYPIVNNLSSYR